MRFALVCTLAMIVTAGATAGEEQPPAPQAAPYSQPDPYSQPAAPKHGYAPPAPTTAPVPLPYAPGDPNRKAAPRLPHPPLPGDVRFGLQPAPYRPSVDLLDDTELLKPAPATASQRAAHILQAAAHLEAAGMPDEAAELRGRADDIREELLNEKRAELARLKAEIAALEGSDRAAQQVMMHVQVLELSRSKLQALGFDLAVLDRQSDGALTAIFHPGLKEGNTRESLQFGCVDNDVLARLIQALRHEGVARVLAEPKLVTVDRRPATYMVGGQIGMPSGRDDKCFRNVGTGIHFVPIILDDESLRCEVRVRVSERDPTLERFGEGHLVPGFRTVEIDTGLEIRFGQTAAIAGLLQRRAKTGKETGSDEKKDDLVETVFLITPELVKAEAPATARKPRTPPAE